MAVLTTAMFATQATSSLLKGFGDQFAVRERNKMRQFQADMKSDRAENEWIINAETADSQWAWDMARTEQLRSVEAQNAVDYMTRGSQVIDSAIENFTLNAGALIDQYGVGEALRAQQAGLEFGYKTDKLSRDAAIQIAAYLKQVQARSLQAQALVANTESASQKLQQSLLLDQQKDYLEYNVQKLLAALNSSKAKANYSARQGTGATSKRLAMEAGQRLGKMAAEMDIKRKDRRVKTALFNKYMNTEVSGQLGQWALLSEKDVEQAQYTNEAFQADTQYEIDRMEKLTIPSFALAARQGQREMQALVASSKSTIQRAMQPYRQKEYLDPRKPIRGLRPISIQPNLEQAPSTFSILGGALMKGIQGAMQGYDSATNTFT